MPKFKIKQDDTVVVIAGKHKGRTGRVLRVIRDDHRVVVEKVNLVKRQVKPSADRPGGTVEKEAPIHISNVALWDAQNNRRLKPGWRENEEGQKVRFDRRTGENID